MYAAPSSSPAKGEAYEQPLAMENSNSQTSSGKVSAVQSASEMGRDLRFIDAIKEGLHQSMQKHPNLILMGQDIAEYGGAF